MANFHFTIRGGYVMNLEEITLVEFAPHNAEPTSATVYFSTGQTRFIEGEDVGLLHEALDRGMGAKPTVTTTNGRTWKVRR